MTKEKVGSLLLGGGMLHKTIPGRQALILQNFERSLSQSVLSHISYTGTAKEM